MTVAAAARNRSLHLIHLIFGLAGAVAVVAALAWLARKDMFGRPRSLPHRGKMTRTASDRERAARNDPLWSPVRAAIANSVSFPDTIDVLFSADAVTLSGQVLGDEVQTLLRNVRNVSGVRRVEDVLIVHDGPASIMARFRDADSKPAVAPQTHSQPEGEWTPASRVAAAVIGGMLGFRGALRRDLVGMFLGLLGCGVIVRGITNLSPRRLPRPVKARRGVEVRKSINIAAPIDVVFGFFADFRSFPQFMTNVLEVREIGGPFTHWVVKGPVRTRLEWDAELVRFIPNQVIAWTSAAGAVVANEGEIRFAAHVDGSTRVDIALGYTPPAGMIGHAIAKVFGADPGREMDQALDEVRQVLEQAEQRTRRDTLEPHHDAALAQTPPTAAWDDTSFAAASEEPEPERVAVWRRSQ